MTTAILKFDSSEWPPAKGGKRLKGKYLQSLENFVGTLSLEANEFLIKTNAEYFELKAAMADMFKEHLTPENVETIIFRQCIYFEAEYEGHAGALAAPENKHLFDSLVKRISSFFESIPRKYTLRIELPSLFAQPDLLPLADDIKLIGYPVKPDTNKLLALLEPKSALEIDVNGFGDSSAESPAASAALSIAKQFCFVMSAHGIASMAYGTSQSVAKFRDSENSVFERIPLPLGVSRSLGRLSIEASRVIFYNWLSVKPSPGLLRFGDAGRPPVGAVEERLAQDHLLSDIRRFFKARVDEDFEQIAAAIEWYQDSMWAENETFAYIAACIGLEAVLGSADESLDSLSKRLSDRYAFLMGRGRTEREALRQDYLNVLKLRGRLVHGKAARLDPKDRPVLKKVQELLLNLVWKEIHRIRPSL